MALNQTFIAATVNPDSAVTVYQQDATKEALAAPFHVQQDGAKSEENRQAKQTFTNDGIVGLHDGKPCRTCPGGCGFEVTWHATHCCAGCARGGKHGPRCQRKPMVNTACDVPQEKSDVVRQSSQAAIDVQHAGADDKENQQANQKCAKGNIVGFQNGAPSRTCPGGCGFDVTWHATHCCAGCARGGKHGPRCQRKSMVNTACNVPQEKPEGVRQSSPAASADAAAIPVASKMQFIDDVSALRVPVLMNVVNPEVHLIHIPKTSGTSLKGDSRNNLKNTRHQFNVDFAYRTPASLGGCMQWPGSWWPRYQFPKYPCLKITVIRNPFDMLVSYYMHGSELNADGSYCHAGWCAVNYTHKFHSFEEFIRGYCDPDFQWHVPLFKQFLYSHLFDEEDNCVPDLILKFESVAGALNELRKIGVDIHREHKNKSGRRKKKSTQEYYTPELRELVEKKCARELQVFGYDFEGSCKHSNFIIPNGLKYDVKGDRLYSM